MVVDPPALLQIRLLEEKWQISTINLLRTRYKVQLLTYHTLISQIKEMTWTIMINYSHPKVASKSWILDSVEWKLNIQEALTAKVVVIKKANSCTEEWAWAWVLVEWDLWPLHMLMSSITTVFLQNRYTQPRIFRSYIDFRRQILRANMAVRTHSQSESMIKHNKNIYFKE